MIKPRQPLSLREEVVDPCVCLDRERLIIKRALETHSGHLILVVIPLVLVILLKERAVAEPADFSLHGPVIERPTNQVLTMIPENAAAEIFFGLNVTPAEPEIVEAMIVNEEGIHSAARRS